MSMFVLAAPLEIPWHKPFAEELLAAGIPDDCIWDSTDPARYLGDCFYSYKIRPRWTKEDVISHRVKEEARLKQALKDKAMTLEQVDEALGKIEFQPPPPKMTLEEAVSDSWKVANALVFKMDDAPTKDVETALAHVQKNPARTFLFWDRMTPDDGPVVEAAAKVRRSNCNAILYTRKALVENLLKYFEWLDWFDRNK